MKRNLKKVGGEMRDRQWKRDRVTELQILNLKGAIHYAKHYLGDEDLAFDLEMELDEAEDR